MKLFLDTNILLDGYFQRTGAAASDAVIAKCDGTAGKCRALPRTAFAIDSDHELPIHITKATEVACYLIRREAV